MKSIFEKNIREVVIDIHDLEIEKRNWKLLIEQYETFEKDTFIH